MLAIVGTAGTIVYFGNQNTSGVKVPEVKTAFESTKPILESEDNNKNVEVADTDLETNREKEVESEPVVEKEPKTLESKPTKTEIAKTKEKKSKDKVNRSKNKNSNNETVVFSENGIKTADGLIITNDGKIITKDGKVFDGNKLKTSRTTILDSKRGETSVRPPRPRLPKGFPMSREEFERLTPEQKRKVRRAADIQRREMMRQMERNKRLRKNTYPKPKPSEKPKY